MRQLIIGIVLGGLLATAGNVIGQSRFLERERQERLDRQQKWYQQDQLNIERDRNQILQQNPPSRYPC